MSRTVRNAGIEVSVYNEGQDILIYDIKSIDEDKSMADVFRVFLQFADKVSGEDFQEVILVSQGNKQFKITGSYFKTLGVEYSFQNPVYTTRTFPENVLNMDGSKAYSTWEGGVIGVTTKQMEDFSDLSKKWYIQ